MLDLYEVRFKCMLGLETTYSHVFYITNSLYLLAGYRAWLVSTILSSLQFIHIDLS